MTFRETVFTILLEDHIREIRKQGFAPDFVQASKRARERTVVVIDELKKYGWTV